MVGTIRGVGAQVAASVISFCGFFLIGVPLAAYLVFGSPDMKINGAWIGSSTALGFIFSAYSILVLFIVNWQGKADIAALIKDKTLREIEEVRRLKEEDGFIK